MESNTNHRGIWIRQARTLAAAAILMLATAALAGCSVVMETTRPTPVDLTQFQPGDTRDDVLNHLGAPLSTASQSDGTSCDYYSLYTHGYGTAGKVGIALAETAADVFTIGLAELVTSPTEGLTRNETHPVTFCYTDSQLARVSESGELIAGSPPPTQTAQSQAAPQAPAPAKTAQASSTGSLPASAPYDVPIPAGMLANAAAHQIDTSAAPPATTTTAPTSETPVETGAQPSNEPQNGPSPQ
jgi:hypothetical protein